MAGCFWATTLGPRMPHSLRVLKTLRAAQFTDDQAMGIASVLASARADENSVYIEDDAIDVLTASGFEERLATEIAHALSYCFGSKRFAHFAPASEKTQIVRAGMMP